MEHGHEGMSILEEAWSVFSDPAHIMAEIGWNIIFDLLIITLGYGIIIKKIVLPKIHKYIDDKHGVEHEEY